MFVKIIVFIVLTFLIIRSGEAKHVLEFSEAAGVTTRIVTEEEDEENEGMHVEL